MRPKDELMSHSWQQGYPAAQYPYPAHQQPYPPQQPYGYPPQGYQQYPPPQPQYPPPPPPPNPQAPHQSRPPRKTVKGNPLHVVLATVVVLALCAGGMYMNDLRPDPEVGKCLVDMDYDWFLGMDVVECEDPEASYEIVRYTGGHDDAICSGYSNGESYQYTGGKRNRTKWSLCAVPIG